MGQAENNSIWSVIDVEYLVHLGVYGKPIGRPVMPVTSFTGHMLID